MTSGTFRSGLNCTLMQEQDEQQQIPWVSFVIKAIMSFKLNSSVFLVSYKRIFTAICHFKVFIGYFCVSHRLNCVENSTSFRATF